MIYKRLYEDKNLENHIKSIVSDTNINDYNNILEKYNDYEYFYFLSNLRHDLFNWYPFKKDSSLLEIGSGYGQLTSFFANKINHVVAVENTNSKAEIILNRAKNVDVIVCDFDKIDADEKFDYIVLCNIFEYAKSFFESDNPYEDYLKYLKSFLKEDGVILIALSNRIGLKYFAGFKEEHTNQYFSGLNGYPRVNSFKTFTKKEITDVINNSGFNNYKFFYPYPNHEFPQIIHTNSYINKKPFYGNTFYFDERYDFFNENLINQSLSKDNIAQYFSNSFLIEIRNSNNQYLSDKIDFVNINHNRRDEFKTATIIRSDNIVFKKPLLKKAQDHIKNMFDESGSRFGKIECFKCNYEDACIKYDFIKNKSLEDYIIEAILENDKNKFFNIIEKFYNALLFNSTQTKEYANKKFLKVFKLFSEMNFHCHNKSNLDLMFEDIFIINNQYYAIDYEWIFDFSIPIEFIFYRAIYDYWNSHHFMKEFIVITEIFNHFNFDIQTLRLFEVWNENFERYKKSNNLLPNRAVISKDELDIVNKVEEYLNLKLNPENIHSSKLESLKSDIVFYQRKVINQKNMEIQQKEKEINNKNKEIVKKLNEIKKNKKELKEKNNKIKSLNKELKEILNSSSWKLTKPLRKFKLIFK